MSILYCISPYAYAVTYYNTDRGDDQIMVYDVLEVYRHVVNYSDLNGYAGMSNMKLQKILYFIQAYFLAACNRPCFDAQIEAWDFGPVVPEAYHEYKQFGSVDIPRIVSYIEENQNDILASKVKPFNDDTISREDRKMIDAVVDRFADYSASDLTAITHHQAPWTDAYAPGFSRTISHEALRSYFP